MLIRIPDRQAENEWEWERERAQDPFSSRLKSPIIIGVSCYKEVDTEDLFFDEDGVIGCL